MAKQRVRTADEVLADPEAAKLLHARAQELLAIEQQAALLKQQKADLFDIIRDDKLDPAHAKVWVAEHMRDADKEERARVKADEREMILVALGNVERNEGRARARERATSVPTPAHDPKTGEITQPAAASAGAGATGETSGAAEPATSPVATPHKVEEDEQHGFGDFEAVGGSDRPQGSGSDHEGVGSGYGSAPEFARQRVHDASQNGHPDRAQPADADSAGRVGRIPSVAGGEGQAADRRVAEAPATHPPEETHDLAKAAEPKGDGVDAGSVADPVPVTPGFAPKKGDPFLDPNHSVGKIYRGSLCYQLGIAERDFDAVRAMMIAGYTAPDAIAALNEAA